MQYASQNFIPITLELGGKSSNLFFEACLSKNDDFFYKCLDGFTMFALNQGEVCHERHSIHHTYLHEQMC